MNIAIIGSGISGLTAAHYLSKEHSITLFEQSKRLGGHTNTVEVNSDKKKINIDTGFIVFNKKTYPLFCKLMDELKVPIEKTDMSFSYHDETLTYNGSNLKGLFCTKKNIFKI